MRASMALCATISRRTSSGLPERAGRQGCASRRSCSSRRVSAASGRVIRRRISAIAPTSNQIDAAASATTASRRCRARSRLDEDTRDQPAAVARRMHAGDQQLALGWTQRRFRAGAGAGGCVRPTPRRSVIGRRITTHLGRPVRPGRPGCRAVRPRASRSRTSPGSSGERTAVAEPRPAGRAHRWTRAGRDRRGSDAAPPPTVARQR